MLQEMMRKGPWTDKEDYQLVFFVGLFGERRWDFIAKVSGLKVAGDNNRTGKSCRLRWVNYLHPGLKRGKLTPQEEHLVLELQTKWGNRWSKIAHKLPGRTDNEIKNYWRTYMRKKTQEKKRKLSPSSSSSSFNYSCTSLNNPAHDSLPFPDHGFESFYETGAQTSSLVGKKIVGEKLSEAYSMDDIWKDIELSEKNSIKPSYEVYGEKGYDPVMASPMWEWNSEMMWKTGEDNKMPGLVSDQFLASSYEHEQISLTEQFFSPYEQELAYLSG